jgi:hypothetical protein
MKYLIHCISLFFLLGFGYASFSQVTVVASAKRLSAEKGEITLKATIANGIRIFSIAPGKSESGFVSSISQTDTGLAKMNNKAIVESGTTEWVKNEAVTDSTKAFSKEVIYTIPVALNSGGSAVIKGNLDFLGLEGQ